MNKDQSKKAKAALPKDSVQKQSKKGAHGGGNSYFQMSPGSKFISHDNRPLFKQNVKTDK